MVVDGVVLAETRCGPCLLLIFTPCAPLSTSLLPLVPFVLLVLPLAQFDPFPTCTLKKFTSPRCSGLIASTLPMRAVHFNVVRFEIHDSHGFDPMCLSCQTCILCAPSLSPVSVMHAAFVVVLVPACNPVACCTCFCRRHIPVLASALCLTPVGVLIPVCSPSRTLSPFAGQAGHMRLCVLGVAWRGGSCLDSRRSRGIYSRRNTRTIGLNIVNHQRRRIRQTRWTQYRVVPAPRNHVFLSACCQAHTDEPENQPAKRDL